MEVRFFIPRILIIIGITLVICSSCGREIELQSSPYESGSFVVFSDPQQGYGIYSQLVGCISRLQPVPFAAFCCGDIMLRPANEAEWLSFWQNSKPLTDKMPLLVARGNHEGNDESSEQLLHRQLNITGMHFYYTSRKDNCSFILLDTQEKGKERSICGEQLAWLKQQLDSSDSDTTVSSVFILMHQPLYPQGMHKGSNLLNADELHELFLKHPKIKIVFAGHDHLFNRYVKDGLNYLTTGGAGGVLYHDYGGGYHHFVKVSLMQNPTRLNIKTIGIFHEVIENFDI